MMHDIERTHEQPQSESPLEPQPGPGPWSDPLPPSMPITPPDEPEAWPFPEAEPETDPAPVPTARTRRGYTTEQQAQYQATIRMANELGERDSGPRAQIGRVVRVLGIERAQDFFEQSLVIEATGGLLLPDGSRRRTPGGVFDAAASQARSTGRAMKQATNLQRHAV